VLSAAGLPDNVVATFSPSTVPTGAESTTVTLELTALQTSALDRSLQHGGPVVLAILLLPFARRWRHARRRIQRLLPLLLLMIAVSGLVAGMTGCGSASGHAKSYTLTITGTSGTLSHSTSLSVTVK
jgi:hypothetical protein